MAICTMAPGTEDGPINCITATTHNGRFRSLGVRPGDMLKYYVLYDEDSAETGISQTVSMDLTVAQVLDDNMLLFEGGFEPARDSSRPRSKSGATATSGSATSTRRHRHLRALPPAGVRLGAEPRQSRAQANDRAAQSMDAAEPAEDQVDRRSAGDARSIRNSPKTTGSRR